MSRSNVVVVVSRTSLPGSLFRSNVHSPEHASVKEELDRQSVGDVPADAQAEVAIANLRVEEKVMHHMAIF